MLYSGTLRIYIHSNIPEQKQQNTFICTLTVILYKFYKPFLGRPYKINIFKRHVQLNKRNVHQNKKKVYFSIRDWPIKPKPILLIKTITIEKQALSD